METEEMRKRASRAKSSFCTNPVELARELEAIAGALVNEKIKYGNEGMVMLGMDERTANSSCLLYASRILHAASLIKFIYGE